MSGISPLLLRVLRGFARGRLLLRILSVRFDPVHAKARSREVPVIVDHAPDVLPKGCGSEINEKAERKVHQTKVREQLLGVHWSKLLHRFELDDEGVVYHQIRPKTFIQSQSAIFYRDRLLARNGQASISQ